VIDPTSRYAATPVATTTVPDGTGGAREVRYLRRRLPPQPGSLSTLAQHVVTRGDRLDLIAARYLGDPAQFWRICDANLCAHPEELTAEDRIGGTLRIPVPQA
jgi:nucleoid-associated protein YgaU